MAKEKTTEEKKPGKVATFFKGLKSEFKKITWANVKTTFKNFAIVLVVLVAFAAVIGLVDLGLAALFRWLLKL